MRLLKNILIVALLLVGGWWLLVKFDILPSWRDIFAPKAVTIDRTPVVIRQVRSLAQLVTITAYTEVTADSTVRTTVGERLRDVFNPFSLEIRDKRQMVVVGKVVVHAGVNLEKITSQQVYISGDSISLQLPPAEVLDVIINPSDTEIFLEEGEWGNAAVVALKNKIGAKAVAELKQRGILYQAEERAREVLLDFLRAAGFQKVTITKARLG